MKNKLTPDIYFFSSIVLAIVVDSVLPIYDLIPRSFAWIGVLLISAGALMVYSTNSLLLKKKTSLQPFGKPAILITTGLFKLSRNPIYVGMVVILIGVATLFGSISTFIFPIIFTILINQYVIPIEEQQLQKLFRDEYLAYKTQVRRWI